MDEDYEVTIYLSATDPEEDVLTFSIVDMPANGTLELSGIAVLYIPYADFNRTDSFTFMVNDGMANSNLATVQLTINPVNTSLIDVFEMGVFLSPVSNCPEKVTSALVFGT